MHLASQPAPIGTPARANKPDIDLLYRRITVRLLPMLALRYMLAYMGRVNINFSFAKAQMQTQLGLSGSIYGRAAGVFFIGYVLLAVQINLLLAKPIRGARTTRRRDVRH